MQVLDYTMKSKGATTNGPSNYAENPDQFTYLVADENKANLHVYCGERNENWINCRDNGEALSVDADLIKKLFSRNSA